MSLLVSESYATEAPSTVAMNRVEEEEVMITKRDGRIMPLQPEKVTRAIERQTSGLHAVDVQHITDKVVRGIYDGMPTTELDSLIIQVTAMSIGEDPAYSKLAARLLNHYIKDEVESLGILSFADSIRFGHEVGILSDELLEFVLANPGLDEAVRPGQSELFEYFGLRTVYDRYLLRDPKSRLVFETPQYFLMRVACGLAHDLGEATALYSMMAAFEYMPSTPTLFNSGTRRPQMSSCYLLDSPQDSLESIYDKYKDVALLSKFAGGIGLSYSRIRSQGSIIKGTNGKSNGIIPFLKTLDSSVSAVNQGGKRKGAACIYLETWHADIMDFLKLRENTGDESMRTHNLNLANWVPDIFMHRVENDQTWSLFDPADTPELTDLYGEAFDQAYEQAEAAQKAKFTLRAREVYAEMMKSLAQTGNGWMTFKDSCNRKANQVGKNKDNIIHLSNLCTEIVEVTSDRETAVCNLGSLNLVKYLQEDGDFDFAHLKRNVKTAIKFLDRVVDINFYPITSARDANHRWRPVGLGVMGLQDVFFKQGWAFDDPEARKLSQQIQEHIYFAALESSCELAAELGPHVSYEQTRSSDGMLQFDLWGVEHNEPHWQELKAKIKQHGLRNALLIAIAPTATIASICGSYECIEPQVSNIFKRETLSGEFLQINNYLVRKLKDLGLWDEQMRQRIKSADGSIQGIDTIPEDVRRVFRTVWEVPMRSLIDMAVDRGPYIDQSQSLNLFMENPNIAKLSSMYNYAWKRGLKTTYYLRSRSATKINKTTTTTPGMAAVACSLENPETCEACQ